MKIPTSWTFKNGEVAEHFDSHVREQLPWYDLATFGVRLIVESYLPNDGVVLDVGASTGNVGRSISKILEMRSAKLIAYEASPEMAGQYQGGGELIVGDVTNQELPKFDVCIMFLVAMFIPVADRQRFLSHAISQRKKGGVIVIVDKDVGGRGYLDSVMRRLTMKCKLENGARPEDVLAKELALSGVQRPLSSSEIPDDAEEWFRFGEFCGWVIQG